MFLYFSSVVRSSVSCVIFLPLWLDWRLQGIESGSVCSMCCVLGLLLLCSACGLWRVRGASVGLGGIYLSATRGMIDGGPRVINTPLRLCFYGHRRWLQPLQVGTAEQPIKDPLSPTPWAPVLGVFIPARMWNSRYNDCIHFHSWSMVTQDSFLLALKSWLPLKGKEKKPSPGLHLKWIFN